LYLATEVSTCLQQTVPIANLGGWICKVVLEEFFDQIDVGHDHAATAVPLASKLIHRVAVAELDSGA
jgi:hypothetical protein